MRQDARHTMHDTKGFTPTPIAIKYRLNKQLVWGFTLIELLIVLIIVGILAGLSVPTYTRTRERSLDREAMTALSLIQAGERMYRLREGTYYPPSGTEGNIDNINTNLQLNLVTQIWTYSITGGSSTFTANTTRVGGTRIWQINQDDVAPVCTTDCL